MRGWYVPHDVFRVPGKVVTPETSCPQGGVDLIDATAGLGRQ
jgi:hypothetical protein